MTIEQIIINKFAHQVAYDNRFEEMSKHNGRLKIILKDIVSKDLTIPTIEKQVFYKEYSDKVIETAKEIYNRDIEFIKKHYAEKNSEKLKLWGKFFDRADLYLLSGFIVSNDKLDSKIHRSQDYKYFEYCKNNPHYLIDRISENKSIGGMSGPDDFLDSEIINFDKCPVPLEFLDPSIALLCKLLPLFGIKTVYSCGGHIKHKSCPVISFRDYEDFQKAQLLFDDSDLKNYLTHSFKLIFTYDSKNWIGKKMVFQMYNFEEEDYNVTYLEMFKLSKVLLEKYKNTIKLGILDE